MDNRKIGLIVIVLVTSLLLGTVVVGGKKIQEAIQVFISNTDPIPVQLTDERVPHSIPVYIDESLDPDEMVTTKVSMDGYSSIQIAFSLPQDIDFELAWGCETETPGTPLATFRYSEAWFYRSGVFYETIAGDWLYIWVTNSGDSADSFHLWVYITP